MKSIDLSLSSLSISARTSGVNGLTARSGPPAFCCMICGPFSSRTLSGGVDGVRQHDRVDVCRRSPTRCPAECHRTRRSRARVGRLCGSRAEVPLAEDRRRVARALEQLAHRVGAARERVRAAGDDDQRQPVADRILPGHQRRARRRAGGLDEILREAQALAGELVDTRRRRAAQLAAAVGTQIAVADVSARMKTTLGLFCCAFAGRAANVAAAIIAQPRVCTIVFCFMVSSPL